MRRFALALTATLAGLSAPAAAWEFRAGEVCEMRHSEEGVDVRVVYDPAAALYGITVTRASGWPAAPVFSIRFGQTGLTISTNRHALSDGGRALTVTDSGFGNVLLGLETAGSATAMTGEASATFGLDGAPDAVAAFRACTTAPSV